MAEIATPAWRDWIVNDFGIAADKVDAFLAEVARVGEAVRESDVDVYGD